MELHAEKSSIIAPVSYAKRNELPALLQKLSKLPLVHIKIKRMDRMHYGNFATVARASSALIILRDVATGESEILPDMTLVNGFEISSDIDRYLKGIQYNVTPPSIPHTGGMTELTT